MKLPTLAFFLAATALLLAPLRGAALPVAADAAFTAKLEEIERSGDINALMSAASNPKNIEEVKAAADFLKPRAVDSVKWGSRLIYTYAYVLWVAGIKDNAGVMLLFGMVTARVDAERCADQTSYPDKIRGLDVQFNFLRKYLRELDPATRKKFVTLALAHEERNKARAKDVWLASGGLVWMGKYLKKHPNLEGGQKVADSNHVGGNVIMVSDDSIPPEFISDAEWSVRRAKVRADFQSSMTQ